MKTILYIVAGLILLSIGPQLILGAVVTAGIIISCICFLKALQAAAAALEAVAAVTMTDTTGMVQVIRICKIIRMYRTLKFCAEGNYLFKIGG